MDRNEAPAEPGTRNRRPAGAAVLAAAAALLLGGCADDRSAGPERGVTVEDLEEPQYFHEGEYLGQQVTVSAAVSDVITAERFEVNGADYGEDSLLVVAPEPVQAEVGDVLQITGTVGQYHVTLEEEGVPPVRYDRYEKYETEPYLYDAQIQPLPPDAGGS